MIGTLAVDIIVSFMILYYMVGVYIAIKNNVVRPTSFTFFRQVFFSFFHERMLRIKYLYAAKISSGRRHQSLCLLLISFFVGWHRTIYSNVYVKAPADRTRSRALKFSLTQQRSLR